MSEDWGAIAVDAADAIAEVGMICTIKRVIGMKINPSDPDTSTTEYHEITAMQTHRRIRDAAGTLIGTTRTVLMVGALGVTPLKSDNIAVNVRKADVDADTKFAGIADIEELSPGGVVLKYGVVLAT